MQKKSLVLGKSAFVAPAVAVVLSYGSAAFAQGMSQAAPDQARQARVAELKVKIANLQDQLKKAESRGQNNAAAGNGSNNGGAPK
jgi:hypothetical protein